MVDSYIAIFHGNGRCFITAILLQSTSMVVDLSEINIQPRWCLFRLHLHFTRTRRSWADSSFIRPLLLFSFLTPFLPLPPLSPSS